MGGQKNSKRENHIKLGPKGCQIMREFQIWPQNSNQMTFDPLLAQHLTPPFDPTYFLGQKEGQMSFDLNFEAKFGILTSFSIFWNPI